jgi:hypothetical protein
MIASVSPAERPMRAQRQLRNADDMILSIRQDPVKMEMEESSARIQKKPGLLGRDERTVIGR